MSAGFERGFAAYFVSRKMGGRLAAVGDQSPTYQPSPDTRQGAKSKATADPSTPLGARNAPHFAQDDTFPFVLSV